MNDLKTNYFIINKTNSQMLIFWLPLFVIINHIQTTLAAHHPYFHCYSIANTTSFASRNDQLLALADDVRTEGGVYRYHDEPYCLSLCRKDLIYSDACYTCINTTASAVIRSCPAHNAVVAWGADAGCIVQCDPPSIDSDTTQALNYSCNTTTISKTYLTQFDHTLANLTSKLAVKAGHVGSQSSFPYGFRYIQYFAAEEAKFSGFLTVYAAGFCVPTMSKSDCTACLKAAANQSAVNCNVKQGAMIFMENCVLRYELYPFYKSSASAISAAPLPPVSSQKKGRTKRRIAARTIVLAMVAIFTLLVFIIGIRIFLKKRKQHCRHKGDTDGVDRIDSCLEFGFKTIRIATNDFSESNKLGQGGLGKLSSGQLIAVKRLTCATAHGDAEFKNEVLLVARLHHRYLARLIGYCLEAKERILIYELAFNGSLDHILFDPNRREDLTWKIRYNIIEGITHGLLYLHEESQLRIIHRDLKASNVLLDESMNPKISDFGTARFGYMPPEYAKFGKISTKVDVFSFGVLLLEIISGRKNSASSGNPNRIEHLLSKVWKCWTSRQLGEVIDPVLLRESGQADDIKRCIHIGLLCVQEVAASRPTMSEVVLVFNSYSQILPPPSEPAYLMKITSDEPNVSTKEEILVSRINDSDRDYPTYGQTSLSSAGVSSVNEISFTHTYPTPR
ncbi:Cysteine-rich receptor-like protein kinase 25 [Bienertia sinuspersici]